MSERLGRVEKHILEFWYRKRNRAGDFCSRSGALQAYYKRKVGLSYHSKRNVRQAIPLRRYGCLQTSFTNALKRLETKGYIETIWVVGKVPKKWLPGAPGFVRIVTIGGSIYDAEVWGGWYKVAYRLTKKGREKAYELWKRNHHTASRSGSHDAT